MNRIAKLEYNRRLFKQSGLEGRVTFQTFSRSLGAGTYAWSARGAAPKNVSNIKMVSCQQHSDVQAPEGQIMSPRQGRDANVHNFQVQSSDDAAFDGCGIDSAAINAGNAGCVTNQGDTDRAVVGARHADSAAVDSSNTQLVNVSWGGIESGTDWGQPEEFMALESSLTGGKQCMCFTPSGSEKLFV